MSVSRTGAVGKSSHIKLSTKWPQKIIYTLSCSSSVAKLLQLVAWIHQRIRSSITTVVKLFPSEVIFSREFVLKASVYFRSWGDIQWKCAEWGILSHPSSNLGSSTSLKGMRATDRWKTQIYKQQACGSVSKYILLLPPEESEYIVQHCKRMLLRDNNEKKSLGQHCSEIESCSIVKCLLDSAICNFIRCCIV